MCVLQADWFARVESAQANCRISPLWAELDRVKEAHEQRLPSVRYSHPRVLLARPGQRGSALGRDLFCESGGGWDRTRADGGRAHLGHRKAEFAEPGECLSDHLIHVVVAIGSEAP